MTALIRFPFGAPTVRRQRRISTPQEYRRVRALFDESEASGEPIHPTEARRRLLQDDPKFSVPVHVIAGWKHGKSCPSNDRLTALEREEQRLFTKGYWDRINRAILRRAEDSRYAIIPLVECLALQNLELAESGGKPEIAPERLREFSRHRSMPTKAELNGLLQPFGIELTPKIEHIWLLGYGGWTALTLKNPVAGALETLLAGKPRSAIPASNRPHVDSLRRNLSIPSAAVHVTPDELQNALPIGPNSLVRRYFDHVLVTQSISDAILRHRADLPSTPPGRRLGKAIDLLVVSHRNDQVREETHRPRIRRSSKKETELLHAVRNLPGISSATLNELAQNDS